MQDKYINQETKDSINQIIFKTIEGFYLIILKNPISCANRTLKKKLAEPTSLEDMDKNLEMLLVRKNKRQNKKTLNLLEHGIMNKSKKFAQYIEYSNNYENLIACIKEMISEAKMVREESKTLAEREFLRAVCKHLSKMEAIANSPQFHVNIFRKKQLEYIYETTDKFDKLASLMREMNQNIREMDKQSRKIKSEEVEKAEKSRKIIIETENRDETRLLAIKKANDLYTEFKLDFLRDLEKQVPLSTRDMYRNLIDVKLARFLETFKMPLSNNVSEGHATEAIYHLNNLIDYVTQISYNSYAISVYPSKGKISQMSSIVDLELSN